MWAFNKSSNLCVRKPPRPRADAVTATASRRWRRTPNVIPHGLALDALVLREHVFGDLVLVLGLLLLRALLGLLGLRRRACLRLAVGRLVGLHTRIRRVMGPAHPMTREITDLLRTALNEQLDWRLDDLDLRMVGHALREFGLDR